MNQAKELEMAILEKPVTLEALLASLSGATFKVSHKGFHEVLVGKDPEYQLRVAIEPGHAGSLLAIFDLTREWRQLLSGCTINFIPDRKGVVTLHKTIDPEKERYVDVPELLVLYTVQVELPVVVQEANPSIRQRFFGWLPFFKHNS